MSRNTKIPSTALTAGALQDHLLQDLALGNLSLAPPLKSYEGLKKKLAGNERRRLQALKEVKPTVDTGRIRKPVQKYKEVEEDKEYVLDPLPKPSLAQKLGLISQPDKPLTDAEWSSVKQRSLARDDFTNPCAICQEFFTTEDQVLLSCSHVFHKACIQAFERFTGKKSCPMCRKIQYQARVVHDGTRVYREKAAIKIQSHWRGCVVRKWYQKLRTTVPPKDPMLRHRFYESKLVEITDRMVAMASGDTVDRFLREMDDSIASSRAIFQHFEDSRLSRMSDEDWFPIEVKALERGDEDCPICLRQLKFENEDGDCDAKKSDGKKDNFKPVSLKSSRKSAKKQTHTSNATITLLSCSHVFHSKCLEALEDFCLMEANSSGVDDNNQYRIELTNTVNCGLQLKCPVCRSLYVKRVL